MKKYIITTILILGAIGSYWYYAQAAIVTVDSYSEANANFQETLYGAGFSAVGQSFTATGVTLDSIKFYLKKVGSPTGNATAILYAHSGTFGTDGVPTGSALATSGTFDVSTLTGSNQLITFNFTGANRYSMSNGTKYVIAIEYTGGDPVNNILVANRLSDGLGHSGNASKFNGSWSVIGITDFIFYVYGDDSPTGTASTISDLVLFE